MYDAVSSAVPLSVRSMWIVVLVLTRSLGVLQDVSVRCVPQDSLVCLGEGFGNLSPDCGTGA
jgi:hypothetical protein